MKVQLGYIFILIIYTTRGEVFVIPLNVLAQWGILNLRKKVK